MNKKEGSEVKRSYLEKLSLLAKMENKQLLEDMKWLENLTNDTHDISFRTEIPTIPVRLTLSKNTQPDLDLKTLVSEYNSYCNFLLTKEGTFANQLHFDFSDANTLISLIEQDTRSDEDIFVPNKATKIVVKKVEL
ncbi:hypothetical protein ACJA23_00225 [Mycoplasma corogypsi]|uniref:hypothetical protein n=1 Tax=Mycoplasma corogypsi TaxID=2106 RepID=UPI00387355DA